MDLSSVDYRVEFAEECKKSDLWDKKKKNHNNFFIPWQKQPPMKKKNNNNNNNDNNTIKLNNKSKYISSNISHFHLV